MDNQTPRGERVQLAGNTQRKQHLREISADDYVADPAPDPDEQFKGFEQQANIKVCGVGGGGGNAVGRMIEAGLRDVEFIAVNTDAQALRRSPAEKRLQIGAELTGGLGAGAQPSIGEKAAEESKDEIRRWLQGADMVFVTAGMGGGTGTGACPIVAEAARSTGALTVAIVTLPFAFEGKERMANAMKGLEALEEHVDTLIVVPNERLALVCQNNVPFLSAFAMADEVLHNGVRAISELITVPGLINLDFADVRTIMRARGRALMGIGTAEGEGRARKAAEEAIICPLLEQSSIDGATGVIVNIKGGRDIGMREVQEAVSTVQQAASAEANIIFGAVVDDADSTELQVTVIAAGFPKASVRDQIPVMAEQPGASVDLANRTAQPADKPRQSPARPQAPAPAHEKPAEPPTAPGVPAGAASKPAPTRKPPGQETAPPPQPEKRPGEPEFQFLFPEEAEEDENENIGDILEGSDTPEDEFQIPTFMRNLRQRKDD